MSQMDLWRAASGRKKPKPTLSQLDLDNVEDYEVMQSGSRNAARGAHVPDKVNNESLYQTLGSMDTCWCGAARGHTWPGEKDGAPHPR